MVGDDLRRDRSSHFDVPRFKWPENYDAVMGTEVDLLKYPVVSAAVGAAAMAAGAADAAYRVAEKVPVFGPLMRRSVAGLSERGDRWVTQSADQFTVLVGAVAARLVDLEFRASWAAAHGAAD